MSPLSKAVAGLWSEVTGRRWARLLVLLVAIGMAGLAVWLLVMAQRSGDLTRVTAVVGIAGVSLALLVGAAPLVLWVFRSAQAPASSYLPELAVSVARKENDNLVLLLGHEHPTAAVAMEPAQARPRVRRRLLDRLAVLFEGKDRTYEIGQAGEYFTGLAPRRLVVVGEAGAGKTVLAMCLAEQSATAAEPLVLIRASVSGWNPDGEDLITWFGRHLAAVHGLSVGVARRLVADGGVVPVLDGLDEMDIGGGSQRARRAVERMNEYLGSRPRARKLLLLTRPDVYRSLGVTVAGAHEVRLLQLDDPKVDAYVESRFGHLPGMTARWRRTLAALPRADRSLLHRPLWLYLACEVFADEPEGLRVGGGLRATLLDRFVGAVAERHPKGTDTRKVEARLAALSRYLERQAANGGSAVDIEASALRRLAPPRTVKASVRAAKAAVAVALPFAVAQVPAMVGGLLEAPMVSGRPTLVAVAVSAAAAVLFCVFVAFRKWRKARGAGNFERAMVMAVVITALAVAPGGGSLMPLPELLALAVYAVALIGTWLEQVGRAVEFLVGPSPAGTDTAEAPETPVSRRLLSAGGVLLHAILVTGLVYGGLRFLGAEVTDRAEAWTLLAALVLPIVVVRLAAVPARLPRLIASVAEAVRIGFPLRRTAFLTWCVTAGLMRTSGSAYQFRHRELQDHLAAEPHRPAATPATVSADRG